MLTITVLPCLRLTPTDRPMRLDSKPCCSVNACHAPHNVNERTLASTLALMPTLTNDERRYQLEAFVDKVRGRTPVLWPQPATVITQLETIENVYVEVHSFFLHCSDAPC